MTIDAADTDVALPHYKECLWPELARQHEQRKARRRRRRARRWAVSAAATATTAAAVAAAVVALQVFADLSISEQDGDTFAAAPIADRFDPAPGDIVAQLLTATERASGMFVVHTATQSASGESSDVWEDWPTRQYRSTERDAHGVPMQEVGGSLLDGTDDRFGGNGAQEEVLRIVNHCRRDYSDEAYSGMTGTPGWPFRDTPPSALVRPADLTAVADGTDVVKGRELARVMVVETGEVLLVDPDTSLPMESTVRPGTPEELVVSYEYLPRSETNLALLTPPAAPDSYTAIDMGDTQGDIDAREWDPATPVPEPDCPQLP